MDQKKKTNIFVLTTEYHFLLSMNIIHQQYNPAEFGHILLFTSNRLSSIVSDRLPPNIEVIKFNIETEHNVKGKLHEIIYRNGLSNLFVFVAYRDLETYMLTNCKGIADRHLVQDGANFYFQIRKSVTLSRLKETIKIYKNLWRKGIFFKKIILFKKHMGECGFIDYVWLTNPEIYQKPRFNSKPVRKIELLFDEKIKKECFKYFALNEIIRHKRFIIYLSSKLSNKENIITEIRQLKSIMAIVNGYQLLIKLHPNSTDTQVDLFRAEFNDCVIKNFVPAELYIANSSNCLVIGGVSASLYYHNPSCNYFSLMKIFQHLGLFPNAVNVTFPGHVKVIENIHEIS